VTSSGQRFRRRALRRGYKVDEVDAFLDRVEATLAGDPMGAPVSAQEVHDVVFRVRFGGYDEWQVDLHLDRVERQLADAEERIGGFGRIPEPRLAGMRGGEDRLAPLREDRMGPPQMAPPPVPPPPMPVRTPMASSPMSGAPMMGNPMGGPPMGAPPMGPPPMGPPPMGPPPPMGAPMSGPPRVEYPRFDDTAYTAGGFGEDFDAPYEPRGRESMSREMPPPSYGPGHNAPYDAPGSRHGRMDMTHELRMPHDITGSIPTSGMPMSSPYDSPYEPAGMGMGMGGGGGGGGGAEVQRVDAMRRTFTPRRFGSGYDAVQVNRLFDAIIASLSGRTSMPISENELDPNQFSLVPGGYFEAEVNQALREVRDLLTRR